MSSKSIVKSATALLAISLFFGLSNLSSNPNIIDTNNNEIVLGGLYATKDEDGTYLVTKVLAVDDFAVHLRLYANSFSEFPADVDPSTLTLGSINGSGKFGIGHLPIGKEGFWNDDPIFIKQIPVTEDELKGYKIYLEAMGG